MDVFAKKVSSVIRDIKLQAHDITASSPTSWKFNWQATPQRSRLQFDEPLSPSSHRPIISHPHPYSGSPLPPFSPLDTPLPLGCVNNDDSKKKRGLTGIGSHITPPISPLISPHSVSTPLPGDSPPPRYSPPRPPPHNNPYFNSPSPNPPPYCSSSSPRPSRYLVTSFASATPKLTSRSRSPFLSRRVSWRRRCRGRSPSRQGRRVETPRGKPSAERGPEKQIKPINWQESPQNKVTNALNGCTDGGYEERTSLNLDLKNREDQNHRVSNADQQNLRGRGNSELVSSRDQGPIPILGPAKPKRLSDAKEIKEKEVWPNDVDLLKFNDRSDIDRTTATLWKSSYSRYSLLIAGATDSADYGNDATQSNSTHSPEDDWSVKKEAKYGVAKEACAKSRDLSKGEATSSAEIKCSKFYVPNPSLGTRWRPAPKRAGLKRSGSGKIAKIGHIRIPAQDRTTLSSRSDPAQATSGATHQDSSGRDSGNAGAYESHARPLRDQTAGDPIGRTNKQSWIYSDVNIRTKDSVDTLLRRDGCGEDHLDGGSSWSNSGKEHCLFNLNESQSDTCRQSRNELFMSCSDDRLVSCKSFTNSKRCPCCHTRVLREGIERENSPSKSQFPMPVNKENKNRTSSIGSSLSAPRSPDAVLSDRINPRSSAIIVAGLSGRLENLALGDRRPTALVRRYGNLYTQARVETLDSLDDLTEMRSAAELKSKLVFSVVVLAFQSVRTAASALRQDVRRILQVHPRPTDDSSFNPIHQSMISINEKGVKASSQVPSTGAHFAVAKSVKGMTQGSASDVAALEAAMATVIASNVDNHDLTRNVEEVGQQIWATLYDYPGLKDCEGLLRYIKECVRVAWGLVNQSPPYCIEYEARTYRNDLHVRFHTSDPSSDVVRTYLWPALTEGASGPCVHKGVVTT